MSKALGLIEVRGKLGAILAADQAVKAADVVLLGNKTIRGGLTTIYLIGDVAAIKAAVEAGEVAVVKKNCLISSHVIPRLDKQVEYMLMKSFDKNKDKASNLKEKNRPIIEEIGQEDLENEIDSILDLSLDKEDLEKMRVVDLRSIAYKLNLSTIKKSEIKYANKAMLIKVLSEKGFENK